MSTLMDTLDAYAITVGATVTVELAPGGRVVEGTVIGATDLVLILSRHDGIVVSRIPWRMVAAIDTSSSTAQHPATA